MAGHSSTRSRWAQSRGDGGKIGDMGLMAARSVGGFEGGDSDEIDGWV